MQTMRNIKRLRSEENKEFKKHNCRKRDTLEPRLCSTRVSAAAKNCGNYTTKRKGQKQRSVSNLTSLQRTKEHAITETKCGGERETAMPTNFPQCLCWNNAAFSGSQPENAWRKDTV